MDDALRHLGLKGQKPFKGFRQETWPQVNRHYPRTEQEQGFQISFRILVTFQGQSRTQMLVKRLNLVPLTGGGMTLTFVSHEDPIIVDSRITINTRRQHTWC